MNVVPIKTLTENCERQFDLRLQEKEQAARLRPDSSFLYLNLAMTYLGLNQFEKSQQVLQKVRDQKLPNSGRLTFYMSWPSRVAIPKRWSDC